MILPGRATGSANFNPASGRRAEAGAFLARSASGFRSPLLAPQGFAEIGRQAGVHRLQIDDGVALDHAEPQAVISFETDNFHEFPALAVCMRRKA